MHLSAPRTTRTGHPPEVGTTARWLECWCPAAATMRAWAAAGSRSRSWPKAFSRSKGSLVCFRLDPQRCMLLVLARCACTLSRHSEEHCANIAMRHHSKHARSGSRVAYRSCIYNRSGLLPRRREHLHRHGTDSLKGNSQTYFSNATLVKATSEALPLAGKVPMAPAKKK
eukprot:scaffold62599_cov66-Phaeocystis_antarctica.AAC.1